MLNSNSGATQFPEIGWGQSLHATPNQRRDAVDNALWVGEPVKDIRKTRIYPETRPNLGMRPTRRAAVRRILSTQHVLNRPKVTVRHLGLTIITIVRGSI